MDPTDFNGVSSSTPVQGPRYIPEPTNNSAKINTPDTQGSTSFSQIYINDLLMTSGQQKMAEVNPKHLAETAW